MTEKLRCDKIMLAHEHTNGMTNVRHSLGEKHWILIIKINKEYTDGVLHSHIFISTCKRLFLSSFVFK